MIKTAIVEDNTGDVEKLKSFLSRFGNENNVKFSTIVFSNADCFLKAYPRDTDIVFLDIRLPGTSGMDAAKKLRELNHNIIIIFVTSLASFAIDGYEVSALDFVLKPFDYSFFAMKMFKAIRAVNSQASQSIVITYAHEKSVIPSAEIYYVEVSNHDLVFHTEHGDFKMRGQLKKLEKFLDPSGFVRVGGSFLVNLRQVKEVRGDEIKTDFGSIHLSRSKKKEFLTRFADYLGNYQG